MLLQEKLFITLLFFELSRYVFVFFLIERNIPAAVYPDTAQISKAAAPKHVQNAFETDVLWTLSLPFLLHQRNTNSIYPTLIARNHHFTEKVQR